MLCHLILILYGPCNKNKPLIFKRFTVPVNRNDLFTLVATVLNRIPCMRMKKCLLTLDLTSKRFPWKNMAQIMVATINGNWHTKNRITTAIQMMLTWVSDCSESGWWTKNGWFNGINRGTRMQPHPLPLFGHSTAIICRWHIGFESRFFVSGYIICDSHGRCTVLL